MYSLSYQIKTLAPVLLSTLSGDRNMVAGRQYIPGKVLLGVLATAWIKTKQLEVPHKDATFHSLFLAGSLKFGNGYIAVADEYGTFIHTPTPLSLVREKYTQDNHLYDLLVTEDNIEQTQHSGRFCNFDDEITFCSVATEIRFHHARDRETGVSMEGQIFNYEAIAADQCFSGAILGSKEDLMAVQKLCCSLDTIYLGRSRTAEYGRSSFSVSKTIEEFSASDTVENIQNFTPEKELKNRDKISFTLVSDCILYNQYGFPTIEVSDLEKELQSSLGNGVTIRKALIRQTTDESFVGIWKLKRPSETCLSAGSTFLLNYSEEIDATKLLKLEYNGLGARKKEGFGQVRFRLLTEEPETFAERSSTKTTDILRPAGVPPKLSSKILHTVFKTVFQEAVEKRAIEILAMFDNLPSPTLCSRLQAMADACESHSGFAGKISKMREIARKQLRRCVSSEYNLEQFLKDEKHDPLKEFIESKRIERDYPIIFSRLRENQEYTPQCNPQWDKELFHSFYNTFFSLMRKEAIRMKKDQKPRKKEEENVV